MRSDFDGSWFSCPLSLISELDGSQLSFPQFFDFWVRRDTTLASSYSEFWVCQVTTLMFPILRAPSFDFIKNMRLSFKMYHGCEELSNHVMKWCYIKIIWKLLLLQLDRFYLVVYSGSFHITAIMLPNSRHKYVRMSYVAWSQAY